MATVIDSTGLLRDRLDQIVANIGAAFKSVYGSDIDISASSQDGQIIGALSEQLSELGQILEQVYLSRSVTGASGAALSRLVLLNGISRNPPSFSTAAVTFVGTPGTLIPGGSLVDSNDATPSHWQTVGDVTLDGFGNATGVVQATTTGPTFALANTIMVPKTVISGWATVTNPAAANVGSNQETDAALRLRQRASVAIASKSMADSIYAAVANVQGVSQAVVFENKTGSPISRSGATDLPPNSIQCVVRGGLDLDVATAIWSKASAGVTLVGATLVSVTDAQGFAQVIKFDRPISADIRCAVFLKSNGLTMTAALSLAIRTAIANYGNSVATIGQQIIRTRLFAPATDVVAGTGWWITDIQLNLTGSLPDDVDISVPFTQFPVWNAGNIGIYGFSH